jgi:benzoyl-CoA-dihydrodiol lyase
VVLMRSAKPRVFCAGANIRMLAGSEHAHKVNFCKFTNETRNGIEDSSEFSGIKTICVANGSTAGGGYELALAADHIMLVDDGSSSVSLPEVPLLAVLPGTGGLTRVVDKRKVRRDHADVFCTIEEGIKGKRAVDWRLVDEIVPMTRLEETVKARAAEFAARSGRGGATPGVTLKPLDRTFRADGIDYSLVTVDIDGRVATLTLEGPSEAPPASAADLAALGSDAWVLRLARELDDAILDLRNNAFEIGTFVFKSKGDGSRVAAWDDFLEANKGDWLVNEIRQYWKRVLKRVDVTSRTLVALVEPGSCFTGLLGELVLAADRSYMLIGTFEGDNRAAPVMSLTGANFGPYPMSHGLTRLENRFLATPESVEALKGRIGATIEAEEAEKLGLVTFACDDIDWADEVRVYLEERTSYSPDALTGLEANLRFAGPETMESKIFARLTAWQNWIFQRPNAVGEEGALRRYGTGLRPTYDMRRV